MKNIDNLQGYPHLMYLDMSDNEVADLSVLAKLPSLIQLDASRNKLSRVLDFSAPLCAGESVWSSGHSAVGSLLVQADLSHNCIDDMTMTTGSNSSNRRSIAQNHPYLECLLLSNNQIGCIGGIVGLQYLQVLDLSCNQLVDIGRGLEGLPLRELNLSNNGITSLRGLESLMQLTSLNVAGNLISSLAPLKYLTNLSYLNASSNSISVIRQVTFLSGHKFLKMIVLLDNPCTNKSQYRLVNVHFVC